MSKNYESQNAYSDDHFPEHWDDEDIEFLAKFLDDEFGARLAAPTNPDRDYDYELFVPSRDSDNLTSRQVKYQQRPGFGIEPDLGDITPETSLDPEDVGVRD